MNVIGVAKAGVDGVESGYSTKLFVPIMMQQQIVGGNVNMLTDRRTRWVNTFGRLKPRVSQTQTKASLQPFMRSILEPEVDEAAFSNASTYDSEQLWKGWIEVL